MKIIGITGTIGAGKGAIVEYLINKGFIHYSVRSFLIEELQKRGLELIRDNMLLIANEFRKNAGPTYIIESLVKKAKENGQNAIIESVRAIAELQALKKEGGIMIAIDADIHLRYARIAGRGLSTDKVSFEKFVEDEAKESHGKEPWENNLHACIEASDVIVYNNGSLAELYKQVDEAIK